MGLRVTKTFDIEKYKRALIEVPKYIDSSTERELSDIIYQVISLGQSPIKGQRNYKEYSESYKSQIRKSRGIFASKGTSPVNLTLTGKMLNSLKSKIVRTTFGDFNSIPVLRVSIDATVAQYHQSGTKKMPRRMILPTNNLEFKPKIMREILRAIGRAAFLSLRGIK